MKYRYKTKIAKFNGTSITLKYFFLKKVTRKTRPNLVVWLMLALSSKNSPFVILSDHLKVQQDSLDSLLSLFILM